MPESFTKSTVTAPCAFAVKCAMIDMLAAGPPEGPMITKCSRSVKVPLLLPSKETAGRCVSAGGCFAASYRYTRLGWHAGCEPGRDVGGFGTRGRPIGRGLHQHGSIPANLREVRLAGIFYVPLVLRIEQVF